MTSPTAGTHDLWVEQIVGAQPGRPTPAAPAGGALARAAEIVSQLLDNDLGTRVEHGDELASLLPLLGLERFDRRALNQALAARTPATQESRA